nr:cold and drought-regulated protein CORA-like [Ipomoea batatas]
MDRYQKVERPREETPMNENEIRITTQGRLRNYITYATSLLQEKGANEIALKAMGRAINKTVIIAELIKRRIAGLHQNTSIGSTDITDTWEPLEEGLLPLETIRHVSVITVTLSKKELDCSSPGYQPPIPSDQVKPVVGYDYERRPNNNGVVRNDEDGGWEGDRAKFVLPMSKDMHELTLWGHSSGNSVWRMDWNVWEGYKPWSSAIEDGKAFSEVHDCGVH